MPFDEPIAPKVETPFRRAPLRPEIPLDLSDWDRRLRGRMATLTGGQSPWAANQAWQDWAFHLAISPGRQLELWRSALDWPP